MPFVEPPPFPASYEPGYWILVILVAATGAGGYFVWVCLGGINRVRGGRNKVRTFVEALMLLVAVVGGVTVFSLTGQHRERERFDAYYAEESAVSDRVEMALNEYYGIVISSTFYRPLSGSWDHRVEIWHDGVVEDCFVHVVDERYAISCGGEDLESSTELPAAEVGG